MKKIITLLLLIFSASVLNARSVKLFCEMDFTEKLFKITITDSKTANRWKHTFLLDSSYISVSKNKEVLQIISDYLNEIIGIKRKYSWNREQVISPVRLMLEYENIFIWSNYQVSRLPDRETDDGFIHIFYFYKQD